MTKSMFIYSMSGLIFVEMSWFCFVFPSYTWRSRDAVSQKLNENLTQPVFILQIPLIQDRKKSNIGKGDTKNRRLRSIFSPPKSGTSGRLSPQGGTTSVTEVVQTLLKIIWLRQNSQETSGMITTQLVFYTAGQRCKMELTGCDAKKMKAL